MERCNTTPEETKTVKFPTSKSYVGLGGDGLGRRRREGSAGIVKECRRAKEGAARQGRAGE